LSLFTVFTTAYADTIVWTNTAGGNWNTAANWSPNVVPGSGDAVEVTNDASYTVNIDGVANAGSIDLGTADVGSTNIQAFQLTSGNTFILSGTATVSTNGQFDLFSGVMIGTNAVMDGTFNGNAATVSGTFTILSNSVLNIGEPGMIFNGFPNQQVVTNYGTVNWNAANVYEDNNGVIYNYGLWLAQTDGTINGRLESGNGAFENYGTFSKVGGTNTTLFDGNGTFNNYGVVDVLTGTLDVQLGLDNGTINTTNGTLLTFADFILTGTNVFNGSGILTNSFLEGTNAVLEGTLATASPLTIGGALTIDSGAELQILSGATFDGYVNGNTVPCLFTNNGTVLWGAHDIYGDNLPIIDNYGLWVAQGDNTFFGRLVSGPTVFNNYGNFEKLGTTGTTTVDANVVFNNLGGAVQTASGSIGIQSGNGNGTFNTASGSQLDLTKFSFGGDSDFIGTGIVSGVLTTTSNAFFHGTPDFSAVTISGMFTLANDCNMSVGTGGINFNGFPNTTVVTNYGILTWATGNVSGDNGPTIMNYGTWNLTTDGTFNGHLSSGTTTFDNFGAIHKTAGNGGSSSFTSIQFNNTGLLDVQTGEVSMVASYALGGGTLNLGLNNPTNYGSIRFSGNVTLGGTLSANLNNLFAPSVSNSFAVVTYDVESAGFTNFNLPAGFVWTNNYVPGASVLSIVSVNPPQVTALPSVQNGTFSFSFTGVPGQTYQIQDTTNLSPINWVDVGPPIYITNSSPITVSNLISVNPQLFYQLILQ
jgi:hypothetical protein